MMKDDICSVKLMIRLHEATKYFTKKKYNGIVGRANEFFEHRQFNLCEKELAKLPNHFQLLENLVKKLKEKRLHKTLRKIQEGKVENSWVTLKGLMSLGVHMVIECEHGNSEYGILIPTILEKINEISYSLLSKNESKL